MRNNKGAFYLVGVFVGIMVAGIILFSVAIDTIGTAINSTDNAVANTTVLNGSARTLAYLVNLFLVIGLIFGILGAIGVGR